MIDVGWFKAQPGSDDRGLSHTWYHAGGNGRAREGEWLRYIG